MTPVSRFNTYRTFSPGATVVTNARDSTPTALSTPFACALSRALVTAGTFAQSRGASVGSLARSLRYFLRPRLPSCGIASSPFANIPTEANSSGYLVLIGTFHCNSRITSFEWVQNSDDLPASRRSNWRYLDPITPARGAKECQVPLENV